MRPPQPYMRQIKLHASGCQQWSSQVCGYGVRQPFEVTYSSSVPSSPLALRLVRPITAYRYSHNAVQRALPPSFQDDQDKYLSPYEIVCPT